MRKKKNLFKPELLKVAVFRPVPITAALLFSVAGGFLVYEIAPFLGNWPLFQHKINYAMLSGFITFLVLVLQQFFNKLIISNQLKMIVESCNVRLNQKSKESKNLTDELTAVNLLLKGKEEELGKILISVSQFVSDMDNMPLFMNITREHLTSVNMSIEEGAVGVIESLGKIKEKSSSLLVTLNNHKESAEVLAKGNVKRLEHNSQIIRDVKNFMQNRSIQIIEDTKKIEGVVNEVKKLTQFTSIIRDIAEHTNILALNASVEAARAGRAGQGFGVIGKKIRDLSEKIEESTIEIDNQFFSIIEHVEKNISVLVESSKTNNERKQMEDIAGEITEMSNVFIQMNQFLDTVTKESRDTMGHIYSDILGVLGQIQFQDVSRQQIEQVINIFEVFNEYCITVKKSMAEPDGKEWLPLFDLIEKMRESYVMEKQHSTHNNVTGEKSMDESAPLIELF